MMRWSSKPQLLIIYAPEFDQYLAYKEDLMLVYELFYGFTGHSLAPQRLFAEFSFIITISSPL